MIDETGEIGTLKFQCIEYEYCRKPIRLFNSTVDLIDIGESYVKLAFKQTKKIKQYLLIPVSRVLSINFMEENLS